MEVYPVDDVTQILNGAYLYPHPTTVAIQKTILINANDAFTSEVRIGVLTAIEPSEAAEDTISTNHRSERDVSLVFGGRVNGCVCTFEGMELL